MYDIRLRVLVVLRAVLMKGIEVRWWLRARVLRIIYP